MCVCISLSAYVTLFCLFSPKISIILLHPDKNVRKLTMNSATYKRAFKPISSVASVEGRNNFPSGGSVAQPEPPSAGPMSTTSNVLNLGESSSGAPSGLPVQAELLKRKLKGEMERERDRKQQQHQAIGAHTDTSRNNLSNNDSGPDCFRPHVEQTEPNLAHLLGPQFFATIRGPLARPSLAQCWPNFTTWLASCCSIGELEPSATHDEFDSATSEQPAARTTF